jgi:hypothetical protein
MRPSRADGVTLSNLTVMEGNTLTVVFTLTNVTACDVAINNFARGAASFAGTGDPSNRQLCHRPGQLPIHDPGGWQVLPVLRRLHNRQRRG